MPDPDLNDHTDVNEDIDTDLSTAPMMNSQIDHERSCFNPSARLMLDPDIVIHTDVNVDIDADLPENSAPMMNSDLIVLELDDAIRREVLRNRTMENMSSHEFNDQLLSPEYVNLNTAEMFLDQVRSVGPRQWNMCIDQYDTVNGPLTGCQCITAEIRMIRRIRKSLILLCQKEWNSGRPRTSIRTAEKRGV